MCVKNIGHALLFSLALCYLPLSNASSKVDWIKVMRDNELLIAESGPLPLQLAAMDAIQYVEADRQASDSAYHRSELGRVERRIKELEMAQVAQEDAVRSTIKNSLSSLGSKINEFVTFGGVFEMIAGRSKDFSDVSKSSIGLNTAEFDFEIKVNDWTTGSIVLEYIDGSSVVFSTTSGYDTSVDRINLDTASITIGDTQKFPAYVKTGRMILPFGSSTGVHRADVLSIESPMTIEVFESKKNAIGFGLAFPTPALPVITPPVAVPPVRPRIINPLVSSMSEFFAYVPPPVRSAPIYAKVPPEQPTYNAAVFFYDGNELKSATADSDPDKHINVALGYNAKGSCNRRYDELRESWLCPWSVGVDVAYNSSIFDSRFLESRYRNFLSKIGLVPGASVSVKSTLSRFSLVAEWNGALKNVAFSDDIGKPIYIRPSAWQMSLGYQLDWHPWVESIGGQGTYLAIGYSESSDLAGVTRVVGTTSERVGFVAKRRLLLTAGEWVLEGVKFAVEYSRNWDYSTSEGGTGKTADGLFSTLTYTW